MPRHHEELFRLFERRVYGSDFKQLSGWDLPIIPPDAPAITIRLEPGEMSRYNYEHELQNVTVDGVTHRVVDLLRYDYGLSVESEDLVLAPSLTAAIAIVLHWLRSRLDSIIADPPYYFSYLNVAERLGMKFQVVPRMIDNREDIAPLLSRLRASSQPRAVVICDPRYVLGSQYTDAELRAVTSLLNPNDVLVVDHAMDIRRSSLVWTESRVQIIRLFSFGKTVVMNGIRMAAIVAPGVAAQLRTVAGAIFGSHDVAALKLFEALISNPRQLAMQRGSVMGLVRERWRMYAARYSRPHALAFHLPVNGILGYLLLDIRPRGRYQVYKYLIDHNVHAMFGQHFGVSSTGIGDLLRINYLLDCDAALEEVVNAVSA